jgi:transcriptional regulator
MARPRKASDEQVFAAMQRVMQRRAPGDVTLAEIAREAKVTAGALVQRFGSKRGLMLVLFERAAGGTAELFRELQARGRSPLAVLRAYADCTAELGETPAKLAHNLHYLQLDLTDEGFGKLARTQARIARGEIRRLLREAVTAGELRHDTDTSALAQLVEVTIGGSLMSWGFYREGETRSWVRRHLELALRPYRGNAPLAYREESPYLLSVTEGTTVSRPNDLVQGTLDLLILKMLALEPLNGWAISQRLKQVSGDVLQVSDGSLYPALHKLEQEGWITAEWRASENNRRAKFYSLTRLGRRQLERETANWNRLSAAISMVVRLREA